MSDPNLPDIPPAGSPGEPLLTVGGVGSLVTAIIAALVAFAVPLSQTQQVAILGLVVALAPFLIAVVGRRRVWSPDSVRALALQVKTQRAASRMMPYTRTNPGGDGDGPVAPRRAAVD